MAASAPLQWMNEVCASHVVLGLIQLNVVRGQLGVKGRALLLQPGDHQGHGQSSVAFFNAGLSQHFFQSRILQCLETGTLCAYLSGVLRVLERIRIDRCSAMWWFRLGAPDRIVLLQLWLFDNRFGYGLQFIIAQERRDCPSIRL